MSKDGQANVLLVDDRPENLLAMESVLAELGQNLVRAASARDALRFLLLEDVALILLDVQMPGVNGFELAELIRDRQRTQHTPIIFVSATSVNEQYIFRGYSLGAVDYLTKPIIPEILKSKVAFFTRLFLQNQKIRQQANLLEAANVRLDNVNTELEARVSRRTAELEAANRDLENEVAVRSRSESRLATEHAVTQALANAKTLEQAIPSILSAFCEHMRAEVCNYWERSPDGSELACVGVAVKDGARRDLQAFVRETRRLKMKFGVGVPGRVWKLDGTVWLPNTVAGEQYPRAILAAAAGIDSAIGFPVKPDPDYFGVIEFMTAYKLEPDQALDDMLEAVGCEIGQFIQRKNAERDREELLVREKSLREKAENASRLKDEFLATVSHELRTPLNSILGWSQIVMGEAISDSDRQMAFETIYRNARSQAQLIDDLLDTSRLITGNLILELSPTNVRPVIEEAVSFVLPSAEAKKIEIRTLLEDDVPDITCDPQRLQQIISNLLTNAVKFTPPEGQIEVRFWCEGARALISVRDSGCGISADFLPFAFDRFRQQDSSSTRNHEGLGLGLSIVRNIAELHGGRVSAESEGEGKGSTFTLTLPLTRSLTLDGGDEIAAQPIGETVDEIDPGRLQGIKVLLVDDDIDACNMLRHALRSLGADVKISNSVSEAFDAIADERPHILIADINIPDEDGYSMMTRLRRMSAKAGANIPAIALTAMARAEDAERALAVGFQRHMAKPVELQELTESISELVAKGSLSNGTGRT
ncbi:MAG: response regulator [Acidobacteriota bacterium]